MRIRSMCMGLLALAVGAQALAGTAWAPKPLVPSWPVEQPLPQVSHNLADLTVNVVQPAGVYVGDPGTYRVVVANTGNRQADVVRLTITLPRTHTSPTVYVLGNLGARDARCMPSGTNLDCPLGTLARNSSTNVDFTIALPQSSAPIVVAASVTTQSAELTTGNNSDSESASLLHHPTPVNVGDAAHVDHCTGTGLTSFFECALFPSSISSHDFQVLSGGMIAFVGAPASYWGTWSQAAGSARLLLEYYDGASHEATFDGYAVGSRCFEGVTVFYPPSAYVSPYRVCLH